MPIEFDPNITIQQAFAMDPYACSRKHIEFIVQSYITRRGQFNAGSLTAGSSKPKTAKQLAVEAVGKDVDLDL